MTAASVEGLHLQHTNVSQPRLQRTRSEQSLTASEDYYSSVSSVSDSEAQEGVARSRTKSTNRSNRRKRPMRVSDPGQRIAKQSRSYEGIARPVQVRHVGPRITPMSGQGKRRQDESTAEPASPIKRKPVPSVLYESSPTMPHGSEIPAEHGHDHGHAHGEHSWMYHSNVAKSMAQGGDPVTPGDDTPYVRFALDQITKDEEVKGGRTQKGIRPSMDEYGVVGGQSVRPSRDEYGIVDNKSGRPSRDEYAMVGDNSVRPSTDEYALAEGRPSMWLEEPQGAPLVHASLGPIHGPERARAGAPLQEDRIYAAPIPPRNPRRSMTPSGQYSPPTRTGVLLPLDPREDSSLQPLRALPTILKPLSMVAFILILSLFLAALIFSAIWSIIHTGLWNYGGVGSGSYFVFEYLPTLLGMVILLWLFEIEKAVYRVAPFIALASDSSKSRSRGVLLPLSPNGFVFPSFSHFAAGQPIIGLFLFASWLTLFTIPLLASAFNVYFRAAGWVWLATQGVIWATIGIYVILLITTIILLIYLARRQTGLKWDARSLADLLVLIESSNTTSYYAEGAHQTNTGEFRSMFAGRQERLGYWQSSAEPNEVIHTLGAPDIPVRSDQLHASRTSEEKFPPPTGRYSNSPMDPESGNRFSYASNKTADPVLGQREVRERLPWFLRTVWVALWVIIALVLLLAFLIVSYLPETNITRGFVPTLGVTQGNYGFAASNFLYSFIPAVIGMLCLLLWIPIDLAFRRLEPYRAMSTRNGALAERSLLLAYLADAPILVSLRAVSNGHFRVAIISFITLIAATLPILAGGVFWEQFFTSQQQVRVTIDRAAYYTMSAFLTIYGLSYFLAFAGRLRKLPNSGRSLADFIALVHDSRILYDPAFRSPPTKTSLVNRLLSAPANNRLDYDDEDKTQNPESATSEGNMLKIPRYGYGSYVGVSGQGQVGIDRTSRPGLTDMETRH